MSELESVSANDKKRLDDTINAALRMRGEMTDLRTAMNDLIKNVAEELNIKPKAIRGAIKVAEKANLSDVVTEHETVCEILHLTGRA